MLKSHLKKQLKIQSGICFEITLCIMTLLKSLPCERKMQLLSLSLSSLFWIHNTVMLHGSVQALAYLAFRMTNQLMQNAQLSDAKLHLYESSDSCSFSNEFNAILCWIIVILACYITIRLWHSNHQMTWLNQDKYNRETAMFVSGSPATYVWCVERLRVLQAKLSTSLVDCKSWSEFIV